MTSLGFAKKEKDVRGLIWLKFVSKKNVMPGNVTKGTPGPASIINKMVFANLNLIANMGTQAVWELKRSKFENRSSGEAK